MTETDDGVRKATEVASFDVLGPPELLLPIHPAAVVVERRAFESTMLVDHTARYTAVTAFLMAGAMIVGFNPAYKTP